MKKILILISFLITCIFAIAQEKKHLQIFGNVAGDHKGFNHIYFLSGNNSLDSVKIDVSGNFLIKLPFNKPYFQMLFTEYEKKINGMYTPYQLFIDSPGEITIDMNIDQNFYYAKIKGLNSTELYSSFLKKRTERIIFVNNEIKNIYGKLYTIQDPPLNDPLTVKMKTTYDSLTDLYVTSFIKDFILQNKESVLSIYLLNMWGKSSFKIDDLEYIFNQLPIEIKKTEPGEKVAAYIYGIKESQIGSEIKNYILNDQNGNQISLDQYKGKYVWIDFWTSWCGPCKQSFPRMKEIYAKYKNKNFEIIGISADEKIDPWLKILPTLNNPWIQVWDNKNVKEGFGVTSFPTSFLINPDGVILIKEIGFNPKEKGEIEKKLEEIFSEKPTVMYKSTNNQMF